MLHLLTDSLRKLPIANHFNEQGSLVDSSDPSLEDSAVSDNRSNVAQADKLEATFKAIQAEFDVIERLDKHGDVNDPAFLREELKRSSFLLAHERLDN